jgi:hypothetical protein
MEIKNLILCLILSVLGVACKQSTADIGTGGPNTSTNATTGPAGNVTLAWNASPGLRAAGYKIRYGLSNGVYNSSLNAGSNLSVTVTGLTPGLAYYFVVNAYDGKGAESPFSNQVSNRVPLLPSPGTEPLTQTASVGTPVALK